jgi:conjugative relaxase-like TrwC/TraI family protein
MLTIGKLGTGQERYYLGQVAEGAEEYYTGEGEAPGEWLGDAAHDLGLEGYVGADQLTAMLSGNNPASGEPLLGSNGVPAKGGVPGFDLTFSVPKSVSLLWGLGGPLAALEVSEAHGEAVKAALDYMQREACWTRRGAGGAEFVKGNGYLAAGYVHRSSRAGDPQLHTHVLIANATRGPDGRWTRLYHPGIYEHAKSAGYIYEAHLRDELTRRLGVEWQEVRNGIAEIAGFSDRHLREFSTRRAEILKAAGEDASARSLQVATLATRKPKEEISWSEMIGRWRAKAQEIGLDKETVEQTFSPPQRFASPPTKARAVSARQVDRAVTASASHFDRRDAIQAVAASLPKGAPGAEVERLADAFLASADVIQIAESRKGPRYTTRRVWNIERETLAAVERMKAQGPTPAGELVAARVIAARPTLKADQREMVRRLLTGREGVSVVIGEAGTGKTFAIVAAAEGWAQAGIELRAAAPTWRAANVMRSEGLPAQSVAGLLVELDRAEQGEGGEGLPRESVLLVDEAGMVDSATLARLIDHAEQAEAKLVLVGDPEQLGEIEAGGLFRAIAERTDPIYLDQVIRHEHQLDREAAKRIREGEGRDGLALYERGERVTVAPDADARREAMVGDWHAAYERGEDAVMIAKRNVDVAKLNAMAREVRIEAGRLGAREIEVGEARFAAGDQVITRVNDRAADIYNRERWQVVEVNSERGSVVLQGVDQPRTVEAGPDYLARTNPHSDAPALEHAYAVTTYSAQGSTFDRAFVMADPSMDKQELYVAASRTRGETHLYATPEIQAAREEIAPDSPYLRDGIPHIAEASERDRAQLAAHEVALRERFQGLPEEDLRARREELAQPAIAEAAVANPRGRLEDRIEELRDGRAQLEAEHRTETVLHPEGSEALDRIEINERLLAQQLARNEARLGEMPEVGDSARRELAVAEGVLAERREMATLAARLDPPTYIRNELGERPSDPANQKAWDRGVTQIEGYRHKNEIKDPSKPFGPEAKRGAERARQQAARRRLEQTQKALGLGQHAARTRDLGRGMSIGR